MVNNIIGLAESSRTAISQALGMAENFVTLDAKTYESLQQELAALRQQVADLQQARLSEQSPIAQQQAAELRQLSQKGDREVQEQTGGLVKSDVRSPTEISDRQEAEILLKQQAEDLENTLRELQRTQSQLVQNEKMSSLGQLVAGVAHEINNPVNFIYGNLIHAKEYAESLIAAIHTYQQYYPNPVFEVQEAIEELDLDFLIEDLPKLLNSMQVGAERIREIIASLRNFSRLDEAECKPADIHQGIDSTLMILQNRIKGKSDSPGIQVIKTYGKLPQIECYPGQLNQVFMNILVNALDAIEERDKARTFSDIKQNPSFIRITTEVVESEQKVIIKISDNGPGIPEKVKKCIFDPFFTTKGVGKGTGLGMTISYEIVAEKHNGTLECFSLPGEGTEFVIQLPVSLIK